MIDVRANGKSLRQLLAGPPSTSDQVDAVCRTLALTPRNVDGLKVYLGKPIELWYNGARWFYGILLRRSFSADGSVSYTVNDPLYYWKRHPDDWYFKNVTATQAFQTIAEKVGTKVASLENTGAVLPALYYPGAEADKVGIDLLANTYKQNGRRFWYRYKPDYGADGLILFERTVPKRVWAFQVGVNLLSADLEESIEETATVVKLVNRETGKVVTKVDNEALKKYGHMVHFEEVDKDNADRMESIAQDLLNKLSKVNITMKAEGINAGGQLPQFFSGDVIYVEEKYTGIMGGYYIRNITQTFEGDDLIRLAFDITRAPDLPEVQYDDAQQKAKEKDGGSSNNGQQEYDEETKKIMEQYGIE